MVPDPQTVEGMPIPTTAEREPNTFSWESYRPSRSVSEKISSVLFSISRGGVDSGGSDTRPIKVLFVADYDSFVRRLAGRVLNAPNIQYEMVNRHSVDRLANNDNYDLFIIDDDPQRHLGLEGAEELVNRLKSEGVPNSRILVLSNERLKGDNFGILTVPKDANRLGVDFIERAFRENVQTYIESLPLSRTIEFLTGRTYETREAWSPEITVKTLDYRAGESVVILQLIRKGLVGELHTVRIRLSEQISMGRWKLNRQDYPLTLLKGFREYNFGEAGVSLQREEYEFLDAEIARREARRSSVTAVL
jgi:hypothetical protein